MTYNDMRIIILITIALLAKVNSNSVHPQSMNTVKSIVLQKDHDSFYLLGEMGKNKLKLNTSLSDDPTWIKDFKCQYCNSEFINCTQPCLSQPSSITCHPSYCQKVSNFIQTTPLQLKGIQAITRIKFQNSKEIYDWPIVIVSALQQKINGEGFFNILDSESSIQKGMIIYEKDKLQILNKQMNEKFSNYVSELEVIRFDVPEDEDFSFSFLKLTSIKLININKQAFPQAKIKMSHPLDLKIDFNKPSFYLPASIIHQIENTISTTYLKGLECKLGDAKLKCNQELNLADLFQSKIQLEIGQTLLSFPIHALFKACKKNECLLQLQKSSNDQIILGAFIWNIFNLQYSKQERFFSFHRIHNQWSDLYTDKINPKRVGFLLTIFRITMQAVIILIKIILYLSAFALVANCLFNLKKIYRFFMSKIIFLRGKGTLLGQSESETEGWERKKNRLPTLFEDSELFQ